MQHAKLHLNSEMVEVFNSEVLYNRVAIQSKLTSPAAIAVAQILQKNGDISKFNSGQEHLIEFCEK